MEHSKERREDRGEKARGISRSEYEEATEKGKGKGLSCALFLRGTCRCAEEGVKLEERQQWEESEKVKNWMAD